MITLEQEKLIFIISQPRAGSTLLQRILGNHSQVHTVAEPWIMLPAVYALRDRGYEAEYNSAISTRAIDLFLKELPNGREDFYNGIRLMYQHIYGKALQSTTKSYFLDKTPRYYYIIPELYSIFPDAKFILLIRNPLDVLNSILNTWVKDNWFAVSKYRDDLIKAPFLILEGKRELRDKLYILKYEQLITDSENTIQDLCNYIGISFEPKMIDYNNNKIKEFKLGDPKSVYQYKKPNASNTNKWIDNAKKPQLWRVFKEYLELIEENTFNELGYSYRDCNQKIMENSPAKSSLYFTVPFSWLIKKPEDVRQFSCEKLFRSYFHKRHRFKQLVDEKGYSKTLLHIINKII
jgi:hypothetical protein